MNKKSIILALLLIGGLIIPQETKPFIFFICYETAICITAVSTILTAHNAFYPSRVSDFLTNQDRIASYQATIHMFDKKKRKFITIDNKNLTSTNLNSFINQLNNISKQYYSDHPKSKVKITLAATLTNNKKYTLRSIFQKKYSESKLITRLKNTLIVPNSNLPGNVKNTILSGAWIMLVGAKMSDVAIGLFNIISLGTLFA